MFTAMEPIVVTPPVGTTLSAMLAAAELQVAERHIFEHYLKRCRQEPSAPGPRDVYCPRLIERASTPELLLAARKHGRTAGTFFDYVAFLLFSWQGWLRHWREQDTYPGSVLCLDPVFDYESLWLYPAAVPNGDTGSCTLYFVRDNDSWVWTPGTTVLLTDLR